MESDYIRREAAIALLCADCLEHSDSAPCSIPCIDYKNLVKIPAADVVEVIRCRDCKFYDDGKYCCCTRLDMWTHEKDYCSRAERREAD